VQHVARILVPTLGHVCVIDVVDNEGVRRRLQIGSYPGVPAPATASWRPVQDWTADERQQPLAAALQRVMMSGEALLVADDDARAPVQSAIVAPLVARGQVVGAIGLAALHGSGQHHSGEDMSMLQEIARRTALAVDNARLHEAAVVASQAKTDFLAVMSHELRTPLNAIIGYTDLLEAEIAGTLNPQQLQQLERVKLSAKHLLQLISEILAYSRMEAGRESIRVETVELAELVRGAAELVRPLAEEKGLQFTVEAPPAPVHVDTDPGKVRQILLNLLSNAVKFTDEGSVRVRAAADDASIVVEVTDTGIGISREDQRRIFEPFWQVERSTTRKTGGTGLGLTVTHRLATLLGGYLKVTSEPGKGSTFTVMLAAHLETTSMIGHHQEV
jgi:signal transduction histidine kinase